MTCSNNPEIIWTKGIPISESCLKTNSKTNQETQIGITVELPL